MKKLSVRITLFNSRLGAHKLFTDVTLELISPRGQTDTTSRTRTLTVLLHEIDQAEVGSTALMAARSNIKTSGVGKKLQDVDDYLGALETVVTQLDNLVQVVDQMAKVSRRRMLRTKSTTLMNGTRFTHMP